MGQKAGSKRTVEVGGYAFEICIELWLWRSLLLIHLGAVHKSFNFCFILRRTDNGKEGLGLTVRKKRAARCDLLAHFLYIAILAHLQQVWRKSRARCSQGVLIRFC